MKCLMLFVFVSVGFVSIGQKVIDGKYIRVTADRDNWENCETGQGDCNKIVIERFSKEDIISFVAPCGGSEGTLTFYAHKQEAPLYRISSGMDNCPPTVTMTGLEDGFYYANMVSCALGGTVQIELITK